MDHNYIGHNLLEVGAADAQLVELAVLVGELLAELLLPLVAVTQRLFTASRHRRRHVHCAGMGVPSAMPRCGVVLGILVDEPGRSQHQQFELCVQTCVQTCVRACAQTRVRT